MLIGGPELLQKPAKPNRRERGRGQARQANLTTLASRSPAQRLHPLRNPPNTPLAAPFRMTHHRPLSLTFQAVEVYLGPPAPVLHQTSSLRHNR